MCMQLKIAVEMAQKPHLKSARTVWILDVDCINVAADFTVSWHCFSPILMGLIRVLAVLTGNPLGFCVKVICHYLFHPHHGGSNSRCMARISYSNEWDTEQKHLTRIQKQPYDNALPGQECSKWKRLRGTDLPLRPDLF